MPNDTGERCLVNPYAVATSDRDRRGTSMAAGALAAGVAGLLLGGSGVAAAEPAPPSDGADAGMSEAGTGDGPVRVGPTTGVGGRPFLGPAGGPTTPQAPGGSTADDPDIVSDGAAPAASTPMPEGQDAAGPLRSGTEQVDRDVPAQPEPATATAGVDFEPSSAPSAGSSAARSTEQPSGTPRASTSGASKPPAGREPPVRVPASEDPPADGSTGSTAGDEPHRHVPAPDPTTASAVPAHLGTPGGGEPLGGDDATPDGGRSAERSTTGAIGEVEAVAHAQVGRFGLPEPHRGPDADEPVEPDARAEDSGSGDAVPPAGEDAPGRPSTSAPDPGTQQERTQQEPAPAAPPPILSVTPLPDSAAAADLDPVQAGLHHYLTENPGGRRQLLDLLSTEQPVQTDDQWLEFIQFVSHKLRDIALTSHVTVEDDGHPTSSPEEIARTEETANRHTGFGAPEMICYLAWCGDGVARVLPQQLDIGHTRGFDIDWDVVTQAAHDSRAVRSGVTHTHPVLEASGGYGPASGLSDPDIKAADWANGQIAQRGGAPCDVASIDVLTCTTTVLRPQEDERGLRAALRRLPLVGRLFATPPHRRVDVLGAPGIPVADLVGVGDRNLKHSRDLRRSASTVLPPKGTDAEMFGAPFERALRNRAEDEATAQADRAALELFDLRLWSGERGLELQPPPGERFAESQERTPAQEASGAAADPAGTGGGDTPGVGDLGGVVVHPDVPPTDPEELADRILPGRGDLTRDPRPPAEPERERRPSDEFDPNAANGADPVEPAWDDMLPSPDGSDAALRELLNPNGEAGPRFTTPVRPHDLAPRDTAPTAPDEAPEPGATRVGETGQVETLVGWEHLAGDGPGTVPGRVSYYRGPDGTHTAVVISPRAVHDDGTQTLWDYDLGPSLASNPGARQVTSVQRVTAPQLRPGTSFRPVRIRTGTHTQQLAGGGAGSRPGSVTYEPVPGNPRLQNVRVRPSTTVVEHADGSKTVTHSALVPANRQLNRDGAPERFQVAVDVPMQQVSQSMIIPAPPPAPTPKVSATAATAVPEPSPALTGRTPAPAASRIPGHVVATPEPGRRGEPRPAWVEQADPAELRAGLVPIHAESGEIVDYVPADPVRRQLEGQIFIPYLGPGPGAGLRLPALGGGGQLVPAL